ncbi:hypothetical protein [Sulfurimonas sp. HSL3-7]|uniref:hypothetical protein n=1 Tax=Sulfonitrofixus jiaomeiensis TaxID=3131938 RepID=UPI0031F9548B
MAKTFHSHVQKLLFFLILPLLLGCTAEKTPEPATTTPLPEITTAYLLEHRIISYAPKFQEKTVTTLPYEIKRFEESYLLYLVARLPDKNGASVFKSAQPVYYLWLERMSDNWRDFTAVHSAIEASLDIDAHYSAIRHGKFYEEYTIDFTYEQLTGVKDSGLDLLLVNRHNLTSDISIPAHYIKAFLEILQEQAEQASP